MGVPSRQVLLVQTYMDENGVTRKYAEYPFSSAIFRNTEYIVLLLYDIVEYSSTRYSSDEFKPGDSSLLKEIREWRLIFLARCGISGLVCAGLVFAASYRSVHTGFSVSFAIILSANWRPFRAQLYVIPEYDIRN